MIERRNEGGRRWRKWKGNYWSYGGKGKRIKRYSDDKLRRRDSSWGKRGKNERRNWERSKVNRKRRRNWGFEKGNWSLKRKEGMKGRIEKCKKILLER